MDSCCCRILLAGRFGSVSNDAGWERARLAARVETVRKRLTGIVTPLVPECAARCRIRLPPPGKEMRCLAAVSNRGW